MYCHSFPRLSISISIIIQSSRIFALRTHSNLHYSKIGHFLIICSSEIVSFWSHPRLQMILRFLEIWAQILLKLLNLNIFLVVICKHVSSALESSCFQAWSTDKSENCCTSLFFKQSIRIFLYTLGILSRLLKFFYPAITFARPWVTTLDNFIVSQISLFTS